MTPPATPHPLTLQMLAWLAWRSRTYTETMDAWRTSCPKFPIWEDSLSAHLIRVRPADAGAGVGHAMVELTPEGRAVLDRFGQP